VPWTALAQNPAKFLDPCHLPDGVQLNEISKMKADTLMACVSHWSERVEDGDIAFRFKAVEPSHLKPGKSKKKCSTPPHDDEGQKSSKGYSSGSPPPSQVSLKAGDDDKEGSESDGETVPKKSGKGKTKELPLLWYDCFISCFSRHNHDMEF
jgi:hypothetical protein